MDRVINKQKHKADMYIIVYNTDSNDRRTTVQNALLRRFIKGALIKDGVYLLPEQPGLDIEAIKNAIDDKLSTGDTIFISKLGDKRAYRGYPKRFRDWIQDKD